MLCMLAVSPGWAICCPRYNLHPYFAATTSVYAWTDTRHRVITVLWADVTFPAAIRDGGCLSEERIDGFANCLTYALDNRYPVRGCVRACVHNLAEDPLDNGYRSDDRPDLEALATDFRYDRK